MNSYQVTKPFNGLAVGAVVTSQDLLSHHRAAQLIDQRKITPLASKEAQPTLAALCNATVRQLDALVKQVQDACLLEAAMMTDTREAARKAYAKRLEDMTND